MCSSDGGVDCGPRCTLPFFRAGAYNDDPLCVEQFVDGDDCCVIITCAGNAGGDGDDGDGGGGPCDEIECGPNADCRHEVSRAEDDAQTETICVCREGFNGDPDDLSSGCSPRKDLLDDIGVVASADTDGNDDSAAADASDASKKKGVEPVANQATVSAEISLRRPLPAGCRVKNETYGVGDEWFDGCALRCTCSQQVEIVCEERCKAFPETAPSSDCELRPDPNDQCCQVLRVCITYRN